MANGTVSGPASGGAKSTGGLALVENAEAIARLYRRLVLLVGVQLLFSFLRGPLVTAVPGVAVPMAVIMLLVLLGTAVALAFTAYALTEHMGTGTPLLWAIAMFLPCINVISLLVLSSKAQAWCKQHGVKVGLLGPTKESIEELRRRLLTSPFE
ncbi:MAG TPA: hypothetical protein VLB76_21875 [Thermoanaerobaculia bacterium]|jgi:hypothetical protein|nr:hypothetical protein [Thermoanaerobaculia bacterium]